MPNSTFKFKQFNISQDRCGMKVNTDGVLLGAWANVTAAKNILDIGTGTSVIALMMAQRNPFAMIDAIEIDSDACGQAKDNFRESKWASRLNAFHTSLQNFQPDKKYDLIIANPPYFINDYKTGNERKNVSKHTVSLPYSDLVTGIDRLLAVDGKAMLVLPVFNVVLLEPLLNDKSLFITAQTEVVAVEGRDAYISLTQVERSERPHTIDTITIQNEEGVFTEKYRDMTRDFYLKF